MALNNRRILTQALLTAVLVGGLALSGCGRKGPLVAPPSAKVASPDVTLDDPVEAEKASKPDRPFILDGLL